MESERPDLVLLDVMMPGMSAYDVCRKIRRNLATGILPIVMVVSQFLMQYYTPSPGVDPQQQKMMAFMMPAISGYFIWNYGSGLGLYWAVGNFFGIAQQMIMNRTSLGREMRGLLSPSRSTAVAQPAMRVNDVQGRSTRRGGGSRGRSFGPGFGWNASICGVELLGVRYFRLSATACTSEMLAFPPDQVIL